MSTETTRETHEFQTEARQLLQLMIHSLYSSKEIFLRELISNASDACDKLRYEALKNSELYGDDADLAISIEYDKDKHTITISDNGIGMNRESVMSNIGTIARSGTRDFIDSLTGDQKKDSQMIGQFGVGFYSAFIVAQRVEINTLAAGLSTDQAIHWESEGEGSYILEAGEKSKRGTEVILHLRDEEHELLDGNRLRHIIKKYSDHISIPINMWTEANDMPPKEGEEVEEKEPELEVVNQASALWTRSKNDISDDEYNEFYKSISFDYDDPMSHVHSQVEGTQSFTTLFYIPKRAPYDLYDRDKRHGVKLYVKRIYIMDDAEHLMPNYLRFVRGIVDSDDLPLNVSREILQSNPVIDKIRASSIKKVLGKLEGLAKNDPDQYKVFWENFGKVLKEGPGEDIPNNERIAKLLRFSTTHEPKEAQEVSLEDYIARMNEGQETIYYVSAENYIAANNSPHLEVFRKNNIEVLLLTDRVDEWMMSNLNEFAGKKFQSVAKGDLNLDELGGEEDTEERDKVTKDFETLLEGMRKALGETISDVRISKRLTDSPACVVVEDGEMAMNLQNMLKQAGHEVPTVKPIFEINAEHVLIKRLKNLDDEKAIDDWTHVMFDQALLSEGAQLADPAAYVNRMNSMLSGLASE
ncbi:Chaperone protein HtpG [hydrothermal vent metagenome]|uniref:Chaperone protein HtpG n=1 Tax=hydrothermal vent metagenome TaxID=652676 RepID=A0A3B0YGV0_9ZZZZ